MDHLEGGPVGDSQISDEAVHLSSTLSIEMAGSVFSRPAGGHGQHARIWVVTDCQDCEGVPSQPLADLRRSRTNRSTRLSYPQPGGISVKSGKRYTGSCLFAIVSRLECVAAGRIWSFNCRCAKAAACATGGRISCTPFFRASGP